MSREPASSQPLAGNSHHRRQPREVSLRFAFYFIAVHAALAVVMRQVPFLATVHAWVSLVFACRIAFTTNDQARVISVVAYMGASEILWRMTSAGVFWEYGKYAVSTVLLIYLFRHRPARWNWLALGYFLLLLPSTLLACLEVSDGLELKRLLSFNHTGPFALAVCAFCLYRARFTLPQAQRLLLMMLGPLAGVAAICLFATARLGADYDFGNESNFDITGGFGPNQTSSALGLGILLAFLWTQISRVSAQRALGTVLVIVFFAMAALTFSRTGVWMGLATILTASFFVARDRRRLLSGLATLVVLSVFGYFIVYPMLDSFTGGKLSARFQEKGFSGREDIAKSDLALGLRHPVLGVGLGMAKSARIKEFGITGLPHTEFTRLIAEHGSLGLLALGALLLMGFQALHAGRSHLGRSWNVSLLAYAVIFMLSSGMRLVAPALAFGLAMLELTNASRSIRKPAEPSSPHRRFS